MSQTANKSIEAVVVIERNYDESAKPFWNVLPTDSYFTNVRLYAETSLEEIGLLMSKPCCPTDDEIIASNAKDALKIFVGGKGFGFSGGLIFKENEEIRFVPSCCCGLDDWDQWLEVPKGKTNVWNGHDPSCAVEIINRKIKVWQDEELKSENPSIEFSVQEFTEKMSNVEKDLKDFLVRLSEWTKQVEPSLETQVVRYFAKSMNIKL